jgi:hypothetical protein
MGKSVETDLILNGNEIQSASWEKLATDPTTPFAGQHWLNTTSNKKKFYDGSIVHVIADEAFVEAAVQAIGQSQGAFDASTGLLPVVADLIDGDTVIRRGDYWDISVAGTIASLGGGSNVLAIGDVLKFVGTAPANPAHWIAIQRNLNDTLLGNAKTERQTVNLVANTPLTVSASTLSDVHSVQVYNSTGYEIILDIKKGTNANQRILTSKRSLTGVEVDLIGAS